MVAESADLPVLRRYWFANRASLGAEALDPPQWSAGALPVLVFAADAEARATIEEDSSGLQDIDFAGRPDAAALSQALADETASYVQIVGHRIIDFAPALELMRAQLARKPADAVAPRMMRVGRSRTDIDHTPGLEFHWINTNRLRELTGGAEPADIAERALAGADVRTSPLIAGAWFAEQEAPVVPEEELRAQLARLHADRERLIFAERRLRVQRRRDKAKREDQLADSGKGVWRRIGDLFRGPSR